MNAVLTKTHAIKPTLSQSLKLGAHLKHVRDAGLADAIGGFNEWIALCGLTRQRADRLIVLCERVNGRRL
ncbi:hypothetical protein BBD42_15325 [Paenibacillus sp. BIHB 4019]|uniref:Uncharacterized protein n=1 Tax=Paenibacillus sp. BIHB 4019 TaxID=1870819 RepID=A0A1B2DJ05_9BACL|nr:hypothetical protein BBD42_15325 [Paenibacillus sp. BIHB 4019]